jgi:hypothetical protein
VWHAVQTDMMKLIVTFHSFTNVPKNDLGLCASEKKHVTRDISPLMLSGYSVLA